MLAEHVELALHGAQIALDDCTLQLLVHGLGRDFVLPLARNAAQHVQGQSQGFEVVWAFGHKRDGEVFHIKKVSYSGRFNGLNR